MWHRIGALVAKELIQLSRDIFFVLLVTLGCISEMSAIAYATSREIVDLPLAVCDYDRSPESRALIDSVSNTETFRLSAYLTDQGALDDLFDRNAVYAALVIPPDFGADLLAETTRPQLQVILNGAESTAAEKAMETLEGVLSAYSLDLIPTFLTSVGDINRLQPSLRVWYNEDLREANYTIPSELGFILYVIALWVAALTISKERELGTMEQLMVTPIQKLELVIGKAIPAVLVSYVNFMVMLAIVVFVFKVPMRGSLPLLLGLALFYILVELQRGLLISALSRTQQQGLLIVFLMAFLDMTFAGYAVPVESMPRIFQILSNIFPIRHWMIIMRGIMLKDVGLEVFWPHVAAIGALGLVLLVATLLVFRKVLND
jgi:ABC-2 type transport system permease protein